MTWCARLLLVVNWKDSVSDSPDNLPMPTINEIAIWLKRSGSLRLLTGSGDSEIAGPAPLSSAPPGAVTFCGHTAKDPQAGLAKTRAFLVIADQDIVVDDEVLRRNGVGAVIVSPNARLDFIRVIRNFFAPARPVGVHPTAVIGDACKIAPTAFVGPLCTIGRNVRIEGDTVIHAGVHIYDGVTIGRGVTIHSGSVIGADGFGYEKNDEGGMEAFPHIGSVVIEDDVEIGANTCIDRGALGDTRIRQGARIDNLVHIAHNVQIGADAVVIANAMIGGSVRVGDGAWIAPSACIRDRIDIGEGAVVGLASLVTHDVPPGITVLGVPARPYTKKGA